MCLSTVYKYKDGEKEKVCEYVSSVRAADGEFVFTDVMGAETIMAGKLLDMEVHCRRI